MGTENYKTKLWMPVMKDPKTGKYSAVLSDDSVDRDEEAMDKALMYDWATNDSLKALANHENKMEKWIGGWRKLKVAESKGQSALFAEPWFFSKKANPLAEQIKNQVDEAIDHGENPGISVGAIIHESEIRKINGKDVRVFTKGELIEATWVPIQSNRNASYGHIAKKFGMFNNKNKDCEGKKMSEEKFTQKEVDSMIVKAKEEATKQVESFEKQITDKDSEITQLKKDVEESAEKVDEAEEKVDEAKEEAKESDKKYKAEKKTSLEKAKIVTEMQEKLKESTVDMEQVDKEMKAGKLPISTF